MFSSPLSSGCQQISDFKLYAYGQLKISDSSMFMLGKDPSLPYHLHLYKHTFGGTSPDWSQKLSWPSGSWTINNSESLLISSSIYTLFLYGSTQSTQYLYMAVFSLTNGTVSNRYKSSIYCANVFGSGVSGDYIAASLQWVPSHYLLIFNRATNLINIKSFVDNLRGICLDTTGR